MKPPQIHDAKKLAYDYRARAVIVLAFGSGQFAGASYGMTRADCREYGKILDEICDELAEGIIEVPGDDPPERIKKDVADTMDRLKACVDAILDEWEAKRGVDRRGWLLNTLGALLMADRGTA